MNIQERYTPLPLGVSATKDCEGSGTAGFYAVTGGTITIVRKPDGVVLLAPFTVVAGQYLPLPIFCGTHGYTVTLAGGASGTLLVQ